VVPRGDVVTILCSGAFDGLHSGHVAYLQHAKALNPLAELVVAIAPDAYVADKYGKARWTQQQRAATVAGLACVDRVVQQEQTLNLLIAEVRPHILVKGMDWYHTLAACPDILAVCEKFGVSLGFTHTPGTHTSETR